MKTGWKVAIAAVVIIGAQAGIRFVASAATPHFAKSSLTINAGGQPHKFVVEVATTPAQWEYGLMFRKHMEDDAGMIFIFDHAQVINMWMKNTYIPLDMVFLDKDGAITHIAPDAKPESEDIITSGAPADAVIELNGGVAAKLNILKGDHVDSPDLQKGASPAVKK